MTRKGNISTVDDPGSSKLMRWIRDHRDYPHDDWCLYWPFRRMPHGYAAINRQRKIVYVHRFMCELVNGAPPEPRYHAAHSCGNGQHGCVNPRHLSWKTPGDNQLERYQAAGPTKLRKLNIEQVDEIRALQGRLHIAEIAARFDVAEINVRRIWAGEIWRHSNIKQFTAAQVLAIRSLKGIRTARQLAEEFNCSKPQIARILLRKSYNWVPEANGRDQSAVPDSRSGEAG